MVRCSFPMVLGEITRRLDGRHGMWITVVVKCTKRVSVGMLASRDATWKEMPLRKGVSCACFGQRSTVSPGGACEVLSGFGHWQRLAGGCGCS